MKVKIPKMYDVFSEMRDVRGCKFVKGGGCDCGYECNTRKCFKATQKAMCKVILTDREIAMGVKADGEKARALIDKKVEELWRLWNGTKD